MIYFAFAGGLAVIGIAVGLTFRWKVLVPVIVLLPFAAIIFSVSRGLNHQDTAIAVLVAEAALQGGYFVGLLTRFVVTAGIRSAGITSFSESRRDAGANDKTPPTASRKADRG